MLWSDEKSQLLVEHAASIDAQREAYETRLQSVRSELEAPSEAFPKEIDEESTKNR